VFIAALKKLFHSAVPGAVVNFRVSCNVKIKALKVAVVRCQFLWHKACWSQSGSFFPDASMCLRKAKNTQQSFSKTKQPHFEGTMLSFMNCLQTLPDLPRG